MQDSSNNEKQPGEIEANICSWHYAVSGDMHCQVKDLLIEDKYRGKTLELRISFPDFENAPTQHNQKSSTRKQLPLIIFSHGLYGAKDSYSPLIEHWVSHGYICINPTHEDSMRYFTRLRALQRNEISNQKNSNQKNTNQDKINYDKSSRRLSLQESFSNWTESCFTNWKSRPADIRLILDSLSTIEKMVPALKHKIDYEHIGLGGHSFGAHTSQAIAGTIIGGNNKFRDERPVAYLFISPQGIERGFGSDGEIDAAAWNYLDRPMLAITGTEDRDPREGRAYDWRLSCFENSPAPDKFLMVIKDAHHGFGGIVGARRWADSGPPNKEHRAWVKAASLLFWEAYLKNEAEARKHLLEHRLTSDSNGAIDFKVKI